MSSSLDLSRGSPGSTAIRYPDYLLTERGLQRGRIVQESIRFPFLISAVPLGLGLARTFCHAFLRGGKRTRRLPLLWDFMNCLFLSASFLACPFFTSSGCLARTDSTPSVHQMGFNTSGDLREPASPEIADRFCFFGKEKSAWYVYGWK